MTKPITITEVALELWIAAVVTAPTPTPTSLLFAVLENSDLSFALPRASRLELIIEQDIKNTPTPAKSVKTEVII